MLDVGVESGILGTLSGNVMVPSQWPGTLLNELNTGGASAAARSPFGRSKLEVEFDSAGNNG